MKQPSPQKDGFVLVTVVWLVAILTVIAIGFSYRAMLERRAAWYTIDQAQARTMARSAANRAVLELQNKQTLDKFAAIVTRYTVDNEPHTGLDQHWALSVNLFDEANYFNGIDPADNEGDVCTYTITDCASLIPINDINEEFFESFDELDFKIIGEILGRRESQDGDRQPRRFASVDEVLSLETAGMIDCELWDGYEGSPGLRDLFTVWSIPEEPPININTAPGRVLQRIPDVDEATVEAVIGFRAGPDGLLGTEDDRAFRNNFDYAIRLKLSAEAAAPLQRYCKTDSRLFKITAHATRRRGKINAWCTVIAEIQGNQVIIRDWKEGIRV